MGSGCSKDNTPDYSEPCSDAVFVGRPEDANINDTSYTHQIPGLCADSSHCNPFGQVGNAIICSRAQDCNAIGAGSNGEPNGFGLVNFFANADCCSGTGRVYCVRTSFTGDPEQCCLNDYNTNKITANCFSGQNNTKACDPQFRQLNGTGCENLFVQNCLNNPQTDAEFFAAWNNSAFCKSIIQKHTISPTNSTATVQQNSWANQQMAAVFAKYFGVNGQPGVGGTGIQGVGTAGAFQSTLYQFCLNTPGACQTALTNTCVNYNLQDYIGNFTITNFCGCHTNTAITSLYSDLYNIDASCMPSCSRVGTIPATDGTGAPITCKGNICIIDNVTIQVANSSGGNVSFQQFCSGCGQGAQCVCNISGVTLSAADADLGNINLAQQCGNPICTRPDPNNPTGPAQVVDCVTGQPTNQPLPQPTPQPTPAPAPNSTPSGTGTNTILTPTVAITVAFLIFVIFILLLIFFFVFR